MNLTEIDLSLKNDEKKFSLAFHFGGDADDKQRELHRLVNIENYEMMGATVNVPFKNLQVDFCEGFL